MTDVRRVERTAQQPDFEGAPAGENVERGSDTYGSKGSDSAKPQALFPAFRFHRFACLHFESALVFGISALARRPRKDSHEEAIKSKPNFPNERPFTMPDRPNEQRTRNRCRRAAGKTVIRAIAASGERTGNFGRRNANRLQPFSA